MKFFAVIIFHLLLTGYTQPKRAKHERIVGGFVTTVKKFPFMAALILKSDLLPEPEMFAGGSVIVSQQWALTAAHCVEDFADTFIPAGHMFVRSNTTVWNETGEDANYVDHVILKAYVHKQYSNVTNDNDIALLNVLESFSGKYEVPVPLAGANYKFRAGSTAVVLGWGTTQSGVDPFTVPELRAAEVDLIDYEICKEKYRVDNEDLTPSMMCAGAPGRDACVDDSGGPIVQNRNLIGVVSWGMECASEKHPGVYTNLSYLATWFNEFGIENKFTAEYN